MTREEALKIVRENYPHFGTTEPWLDLEKALATLIPELRESEDERIRKLLVWQVHRNIEDETNDLAQSVYDGIKGHDPDIEESIEDWKRCLAYLEKHKEQKKPTLDDPDLYGDWDKDLLEEIHSWLGNLDGKYTPYTIDDIKLTARHFVEWQKEKEHKPMEWSEEDKENLLCVCGLLKHYLSADYKGSKYWDDAQVNEWIEWTKNLPNRFQLQHKQEWSEEDENTINLMIAILRENYPDGLFKTNPVNTTCMSAISTDMLIKRIESLHPHWKPSEEQMDALLWCAAHLGGADHRVLAELYEHLKKLM